MFDLNRMSKCLLNMFIKLNDKLMMDLFIVLCSIRAYSVHLMIDILGSDSW